MKGANSPDQVKAVLDYYNEHAGTRYVGNVTDTFQAAVGRMESLGFTYKNILDQYNLRKSSDPVELETRVLKEPTLRFADRDAFLKDGDWGVMSRGRAARFKK